MKVNVLRGFAAMHCGQACLAGSHSNIFVAMPPASGIDSNPLANHAAMLSLAAAESLNCTARLQVAEKLVRS